MDHIEAHSTHHSDAIVTENPETAAYFTKQVDSAAVYVKCIYTLYKTGVNLPRL